MFATHSRLESYSRKGYRVSFPLLLIIVSLIVAAPRFGQAQTEAVLYSFTGGADGSRPNSTLTVDAQGDLYGTTSQGGTYGYGTVFELTSAGAEKVLFSFKHGASSFPAGGVIADAKGNFYGVTAGATKTGKQKFCSGTVYELKTNGKKKMLFCFKDPGSGATPVGDLLKDAQGNLFGTTSLGGMISFFCPNGCGTVFEVTPHHQETVLHYFIGQGVDGSVPRAGLIQDAQGNFYGTTIFDGVYGGGTVFELSSSHYGVLYNFSNSGFSDGSSPMAPLLLDALGNLYGTTGHGGTYGDGTVFKLTPQGVESVLHSFSQTDGQLPVAGLIQDAEGNLYGTTSSGGLYGGNYGYGTVFKITPDGTETVLYNFTGGAHGANPEAGLILDANGDLYGTTTNGGAYACGTVFKVTP